MNAPFYPLRPLNRTPRKPWVFLILQTLGLAALYALIALGTVLIVGGWWIGL